MSERDPLHIVGQVIDGKYEVERLVGEGGFALVYRAMHNVWKKPVAIKLFSGLSSAPPDQREDLKQQFINEGALLSELSTKTATIVQARDVGDYTTPEGQWMPYMVLEWLDGESLEDVLERERAQGASPWPLERAYELLTPLKTALEVAHAKGIAHRDIKPPNFFVCSGSGDPRTGNPTVKLLDFGVAKMVNDNTQLQAALAKTGMNITSFTPAYGAPEQFSRGHGATGPWTDVFALALVYIEMVAGRPALDGTDLVQLGFSSGNPERRPTPRGLGVAVSDEVEAVFQKALAVSPTDRYQNAAEFWDELGAALATPRSATPHAATVVAPPPESAADPIARTMDDTSPPGQQITTAMSGAVTRQPSTAAPPSKGGGTTIAVVAVALLAVGGGAAFFLTRGGGEAAEAPPPTGAPTAAPAASSAAVATPAPACPPEMATIAAGQFFMGSDDENATAAEKPSHNVKLDAFCIDLYEVTVARFKKCSDMGKCRRASKDNDWPGISKHERATYDPLCNANEPEARANHPVNCVPWAEANNYCKAMDKRLPTEAEWEYATRGPDGRIYPWGDEDPTEKHLNACGKECRAWGKKNGVQLSVLYDADDGFATTAPVGQYEAGRSKFGPYDVVGNVWEWVADWRADYTAEARVNPKGPESGEKRVIRGGAWNGSYKSWLHPSFRYAQVPEARSYGIGFRCAKSLAPAK